MQSANDLAEESKQKRLVELLAEETHQPLNEVEPIYGTVLAQLKETAEVPDFVPVFAWRRARALLIHR